MYEPQGSILGRDIEYAWEEQVGLTHQCSPEHTYDIHCLACHPYWKKIGLVGMCSSPPFLQPPV